jgi:hypothetical protein
MRGGSGEAVVAPIFRTLVNTGRVEVLLNSAVLQVNMDKGANKVVSATISKPKDSTTSRAVPQASDGRSGWPALPPEAASPTETTEIEADFFVLAIPPFCGAVRGLPTSLAQSLEAIQSRATVGLQHWSTGESLYEGAILSGLAGPMRCTAAMEQLRGDEGPNYGCPPVYYCGDFDDEEAALWTQDYAEHWLVDNAPVFQAGDPAQRPHVKLNDMRSDRYVCANVATQAVRRFVYETDTTNLLLAGDWPRTAYSCGSIEAAVTSGLEAARHILEAQGCTLNFTIVGSLLEPQPASAKS